jgi:hypothetical protein
MEHSDSPAIWDHTMHSIRSGHTLPKAPQRTVSGNAWCYDCEVPIAAHWDAHASLNYHAKDRKFLSALNPSKKSRRAMDYWSKAIQTMPLMRSTRGLWNL